MAKVRSQKRIYLKIQIVPKGDPSDKSQIYNVNLKTFKSFLSFPLFLGEVTFLASIFGEGAGIN